MRRFALLLGLILVIGFIGTRTYAQSTVTVTALYDGIRMRKGPGTQFPTIATIPLKTTLTALARSANSDWVGVEYQSQRGWLNITVLNITGRFGSLPVKDENSLLAPVPAAGGPAATAAPPQDGDIVSLTLYANTSHVNYYHLVYYSDGLKITGYYAEPRYPGKYPAIIYNHGGVGPGGALDGTELAPFAEAGFVVAASQYRGTLGSEGNDQLGGLDVHDVTNLIPLLKKRDLVDADRIAMFGASRGGMMTYLALKQQAAAGTNDIKVAATVSGLTDLVLWAKEQPVLTHGAYQQYVGYSLYGNFAAFTSRSATYWPESIRVPLLILHGDADTVVGVEQAQKLYKKLLAIGSPVKLIVYPGDGHGLPGNTEGLPDVMSWLQKYVAIPGKDVFYYGVHKDDIFAAYAQLRTK